MEDLSLHILDIAENSITAGAGKIRIKIIEDVKKSLFVRDSPLHLNYCAKGAERRERERYKVRHRRGYVILPAHEIMPQFMGKQDDHNGYCV